MERAAILGIYDFIGYSLCRYMLDLGVEIDGIHPEGCPEDYYIEEKRLEIGRNANFSEKGLQNWDVKGAEDFLFVTLFEALQTRSGSNDLWETVLREIEKRHLKKLPTAVILPACFAQENADMRKVEEKIIHFISGRESSILTIYLPTIYGPWQPEEFFFQQVMSLSSAAGRNIPALHQREWTQDCLYIDDAVRTINEMAESGSRGQYLLSSGQQDRWLKCAKELVGQDASRLKNNLLEPVIKDSIQVREVGQNEQVSIGLNRQKEHFSRIQDSRV